MKIKFKKTDKISKLLTEIEALRIVFETLPTLPHAEENLRRETLLKSSLFSARIEGNPLTLEQASLIARSVPKRDIAKVEIFNLMRAYKYVYTGKIPKKVTTKFICGLHETAMRGLTTDSGRFRDGPGAIFNQAGVAIHLAPSHFKLSGLLKELVNMANRPLFSTPVNAAIIHFLFEKIHPFGDGNGRVGRLLSAYVLQNGGYGFKGLVSFEEFIDKNRQTYYQTLEPANGTTSFVEFFLESVTVQARSALDQLKERRDELPEETLLPRRREILNIIKDHPYCSFDAIRRRFPIVNPKTLHYDLNKLQRQGFVQKVGVSRGSVYKTK
ncbi:Fic family protein [Candidatus Curtissbacteria bacterium]|nr:Fic family protein [Candidatus Curtissbacteria bacterium]